MPSWRHGGLISKLDMCSILLHGNRGDKLPPDRGKEGQGGRKIIPACPCLSSRVEHPTRLHREALSFKLRAKVVEDVQNDRNF